MERQETGRHQHSGGFSPVSVNLINKNNNGFSLRQTTGTEMASEQHKSHAHAHTHSQGPLLCFCHRTSPISWKLRLVWGRPWIKDKTGIRDKSKSKWRNWRKTGKKTIKTQIPARWALQQRKKNNSQYEHTLPPVHHSSLERMATSPRQRGKQGGSWVKHSSADIYHLLRLYSLMMRYHLHQLFHRKCVKVCMCSCKHYIVRSKQI